MPNINADNQINGTGHLSGSQKASQAQNNAKANTNATGITSIDGDPTGTAAPQFVVSNMGIAAQTPQSVIDYGLTLSTAVNVGIDKTADAINTQLTRIDGEPDMSDILDAWSSTIKSAGPKVDINALVQLVLRKSYGETTKNLGDFAQKVQFFNQVKKEIRSEISKQRKIRSNYGLAKNTDGTPIMLSKEDQGVEGKMQLNYSGADTAIVISTSDADEAKENLDNAKETLRTAEDIYGKESEEAKAAKTNFDKAKAVYGSAVRAYNNEVDEYNRAHETTSGLENRLSGEQQEATAARQEANDTLTSAQANTAPEMTDDEIQQQLNRGGTYEFNFNGKHYQIKRNNSGEYKVTNTHGSTVGTAEINSQNTIAGFVAITGLDLGGSTLYIGGLEGGLSSTDTAYDNKISGEFSMRVFTPPTSSGSPAVWYNRTTSQRLESNSFNIMGLYAPQKGDESSDTSNDYLYYQIPTDAQTAMPLLNKGGTYSLTSNIAGRPDVTLSMSEDSNTYFVKDADGKTIKSFSSSSGDMRRWIGSHFSQYTWMPNIPKDELASGFNADDLSAYSFAAKREGGQEALDAEIKARKEQGDVTTLKADIKDAKSTEADEYNDIDPANQAVGTAELGAEKKLGIYKTEQSEADAAKEIKDGAKGVFDSAKSVFDNYLIDTVAKLDAYIEKLEADLKTVGDDAQLANLDLQNILQKQQRTLQLMSTISKMLFDTALAIVRKIGG